MKKVLVLGGYGNFGKRIVEHLAARDDIELLVAGRDHSKAQKLISELTARTKAKLTTFVCDIFANDFADNIKQISPFLTIHTSGPFQGQDYRVPKACIEASSHYIDLGDDRRFVCDITQLDGIAKAQQVSVISGASSVPGLSSAVIDELQSDFKQIKSLDIAIAPGNKAERGAATVGAILSYTGHSFPVFRQGSWQEVYGWMQPRKIDFTGIVGKRWLANVDVPDLELFPKQYQVTEQVKFQAGLELSSLHLPMVAMAKLAKIGLVKDWSKYTQSIVAMSKWFLPFGSDIGGMRIEIKGQDQNGKDLQQTWNLQAPNSHGPYIPTFSTLILANKLLDGEKVKVGARACSGLLTLAEFNSYFEPLGISHSVTRVVTLSESIA